MDMKCHKNTPGTRQSRQFIEPTPINICKCWIESAHECSGQFIQIPKHQFKTRADSENRQHMPGLNWGFWTTSKTPISLHVPGTLNWNRFHWEEQGIGDVILQDTWNTCNNLTKAEIIQQRVTTGLYGLLMSIAVPCALRNSWTIFLSTIIIYPSNKYVYIYI